MGYVLQQEQDVACAIRGGIENDSFESLPLNNELRGDVDVSYNRSIPMTS